MFKRKLNLKLLPLNVRFHQLSDFIHGKVLLWGFQDLHEDWRQLLWFEQVGVLGMPRI